MLSAGLMKLLIVLYGLIMVAAATEGKLVLALYWLGALILNIAVFMMSSKN